MMKEQLTEEQAIAFYDSGAWKDMSDEEIVKLQLFQDHLMMPFDRFHQAVEKVLKRPVFTHEFALSELLQKEYLGEREPPTFEEIINLIPKEKRIIVIQGG